MKCKEINEIWPVLYCNIASLLYKYACIIIVLINLFLI